MVVLARGDVDVATWPLGAEGRPDLALVNELARLQLAAKRLGCTVRLVAASAELTQLLELVGLLSLFAGRGAPLRVEMFGQAEGGEQVGVEEVVVPDDPVA
jgi:hypothetical protein